MKTTELAVRDRITIVADSKSEAIERLNASVDLLRELAVADKSRGILVTRRGIGRFTVELSRSVPYGLTLESSDEDSNN